MAGKYSDFESLSVRLTTEINRAPNLYHETSESTNKARLLHFESIRAKKLVFKNKEDLNLYDVLE